MEIYIDRIDDNVYLTIYHNHYFVGRLMVRKQALKDFMEKLAFLFQRGLDNKSLQTILIPRDDCNYWSLKDLEKEIFIMEEWRHGIKQNN